MDRQRSGIPSAVEFGRLLAGLARLGLTGTHVAEAVGSTPAGRTRSQIAEQLRAWLRTR